jgi:hypothetical protein
MFDDVQRELSRLWRLFGAAVQRAARELALEASRRVGRIPAPGPIPTRLRPPAVRTPVPHRLALPRRLRGGIPGGILDRQRVLASRRTAAALPVAAYVEAGAERVADVFRQRLLDLQTTLHALQQRLGRRREGSR